VLLQRQHLMFVQRQAQMMLFWKVEVGWGQMHVCLQRQVLMSLVVQLRQLLRRCLQCLMGSGTSG
jgi:hypothetical protein